MARLFVARALAAYSASFAKQKLASLRNARKGSESLSFWWLGMVRSQTTIAHSRLRALNNAYGSSLLGLLNTSTHIAFLPNVRSGSIAAEPFRPSATVCPLLAR